MLIYLLCFLISAYLLFVSNKVKNNGQKSIIIIIALIIPCLLAAFRANSIGTDLSVYVNPLYTKARYANSWQEFYNSTWIFNYQLRQAKNFEVGFLLIVFSVTKIFKNFQILLFFIECLIIFPTYKAFEKLVNQNENIWFVMLIYYFTLFNIGLNIVRQFIGISFAFLGLSYFLDDKNKNNLKAFMYIFIGMLFHKSTIISLVVYFFYKLLKKCNNKFLKFKEKKFNLKKIVVIFIILASFLMLLNIKKIVVLLKSFGLVDYYGYINFKNSVGVSLSKIIMVLPIIFIYIWNKKDVIKNNDYEFYFLNYILYFITLLLSSISEFASRIGYLFQVFNCISLTILCHKSQKNKYYLYLFVLAYVIFYWWYFFVHLGYNQTVPYIFFNK